MDSIEVEVYDAAKDTWAKAKRIEKPLLFYGDLTRENDRGSVWGWGDKGGPVALLELYQNVQDRKRWIYALCNTSGRGGTGKHNGGPWWRENESASGLKDIPGAPPLPRRGHGQRQRESAPAGSSPGTSSGTRTTPGTTSAGSTSRWPHYRDEATGLLEAGLYILANGTSNT